MSHAKPVFQGHWSTSKYTIYIPQFRIIKPCYEITNGSMTISGDQKQNRERHNLHLCIKLISSTEEEASRIKGL